MGDYESSNKSIPRAIKLSNPSSLFHTHSASGSAICTICVAGKYISNNATDHLSHDEEADCSVCASGSWSHEGYGNCTSYIAGKYLTDEATDAVLHNDESLCLVCGVGKYSDGPSFSLCTDCLAGKAAVGALSDEHDAESDCTICPAGKYSNVGEVCKFCGYGKYLTDSGTDRLLHDSEVACDLCEAGKYLADNGTDTMLHDSPDDCSVCSYGRWSHKGFQNCTSCIAGKFLTDDGVDVSNHDDESDCSICAANHYSYSNSSVCTGCAAGKFIIDVATDPIMHDNEDDCNLTFPIRDAHVALETLEPGATGNAYLSFATYAKLLPDAKIVLEFPSHFHSVADAGTVTILSGLSGSLSMSVSNNFTVTLTRNGDGNVDGGIASEDRILIIVPSVTNNRETGHTSHFPKLHVETAQGIIYSDAISLALNPLV